DVARVIDLACSTRAVRVGTANAEGHAGGVERHVAAGSRRSRDLGCGIAVRRDRAGYRNTRIAFLDDDRVPDWEASRLDRVDGVAEHGGRLLYRDAREREAQCPTAGGVSCVSDN